MVGIAMLSHPIYKTTPDACTKVIDSRYRADYSPEVLAHGALKGGGILVGICPPVRSEAAVLELESEGCLGVWLILR